MKGTVVVDGVVDVEQHVRVDRLVDEIGVLESETVLVEGTAAAAAADVVDTLVEPASAAGQVQIKATVER